MLQRLRQIFSAQPDAARSRSFAKGDAVTLKGGGRAMIVVAIEHSEYGEMVRCRRTDDSGSSRIVVLPEAELERAVGPEPS